VVSESVLTGPNNKLSPSDDRPDSSLTYRLCLARMVSEVVSRLVSRRQEDGDGSDEEARHQVDRRQSSG
jgi:hypothetical protein